MVKKKKNNKNSNIELIIDNKSARRQNRIFLISLFVISFFAYSNTFKHLYVLDDYGVLADNWVVKSGSKGISTILKTPYRYGVNNLTDNLYRPLPLVMYAVEWQISPDNPGFYHFINVLFYALSIVLLYLFLKRLFQNFNHIIPFFIALLFALHPIHSEVVANIKSRDEIMSFLFLMLTFISYLNYLDKKDVKQLIFSIITYFLAFLSKEGVVMMLFIFPLFHWYRSKKSIKEYIYLFALMCLPVVAYVAIRHSILSQYSASNAISFVDNFMAHSPNYLLQFSTAVAILGKYFLKLFIPYPLIADYGFAHFNFVKVSNPVFILSFVLYIALLVFAIRGLLKKSWIAFGIIFYLIAISIYSNIVFVIGSPFADRFLFLPSLGFCIAFIIFLNQILSPKERRKENLHLINSHKLTTYILIPVFVIFGYMTRVRAAQWKDQYTLFEADVKKAPNSAHLRLWWGLALRDDAMDTEDLNRRNEVMQQAVAQFEKAVEIYPKYTDGFEQLGLAWFRLGDNEKAEQNYQQALSFNPEKAVTISNYGILFFERGEYQTALEMYLKAVDLDPNYSDAWFNLGSTYGTIGEYDKAIEAFENCIKYDPQNHKAYEFIAMTYEYKNMPEEANDWKNKANQIKQKQNKRKRRL
ncbi:MAG: tetratricopeptide repeat protein [Bacteroidales bacterium]|jgi:tetratricopeptide (TPR) repeat protein|nr:tetratricopeptide repeat protein [Bacteroidales bacterium]